MSDAGAVLDLHAGALVVREVGLLVLGASGSGKSALAAALVVEAGRAGAFARIVADDRVLVERHGERLVARPHPRGAGLTERRGLGIVSVPYEPACVLHLVLDLVPAEAFVRMPEEDARRVVVAGVTLPRLALPAKASVADNVYRIVDDLNRFRACS